MKHPSVQQAINDWCKQKLSFGKVTLKEIGKEISHLKAAHNNRQNSNIPVKLFFKN